MSETSSRLLRALRDLLLAMINATLILAILCLVLGLRLTNRVDSVASHFAESLISVDPLRNDVQAMTTEIAGLRSELAALRDDTGAMTSEAAQALTRKIDGVEARIDGVGARVEEIRARVQAVEFDPSVMINQVIEAAARETVDAIGQLAGCELPGPLTPNEMAPPAEDGATR